MTPKLIFLVLIISLGGMISCTSDNIKDKKEVKLSDAGNHKNQENMNEMIIHTVVFSLMHPTGSDATEEFLHDARELLTSIPGVEDFEVRRQVSPKSGFQYGFSMKFSDREAYAAYNEHPVHVNFVENRWKKEVTDFQELDFKVIP